jgi:hypothetical protein
VLLEYLEKRNFDMDQEAFLEGQNFLKNHELKSYDNSFPLGIIRLEDAERAIRHALSTYIKLLNPNTNVEVISETSQSEE